MAVWVVRAGREGQEEGLALARDVAVIGWDELPDLSAVQSQDELRTLYRQVFPEASSATVGQNVSQLWAFRSEIREGDLVVLPLKTTPDSIAVGRVTSPYRYRSDLPANAHHTHSVDWIGRRIPRAALASDLLTAINLPPTVSKVGAPNAEERLDAVLRVEQDPGPSDGVSTGALDRQSEEYARAVFTKMYHDPDVRREVLEILAASVRHAHAVGPRAWELTLRPSSFTMNVGMVWVVSGSRDKLHLLVDGSALEPGVREAIAGVGTLTRDEGFRSLRDPYSAGFEGDNLATLRHMTAFQSLQEAHFRIIEEGRARHSVAVFAKAHSPGLLKYMRAELGEELPDPEYAVSPAAPPARNVWLFQANPAKYDLAGHLRQAKPGDEDDWYVSRYGDEMRAGDVVLLWQSGAEDAGLYAVGELTGPPFHQPLSGWRVEAGDSSALELAVPFRYTHILPAPVPRSTLQQRPELAGMQVLRQPQGTNFKVTQEEWRSIQTLLDPAAAPAVERYAEPPFESIVDSIQSQGMRLDEGTLRRYHVSLKVRGFVILSGISGTGKTWLASAYARAVGAECVVVPVAPNWTTNEDLLGYWSPLDNTYHDTELSCFLRRASEEYARSQLENRRARPYHAVLDEMNLARVEYYFARFLSAMEERARQGVGRVALAPNDAVLLPPNLYFVGTVNVDETTQSFADKVYDRAQLIELPAPREALLLHIGEQPYRELLMQLWDCVHEVAPFAFRVVDEIRMYVDQAQAVGGTWKDAFDEQVLQKILPKLTKTDARAGDALKGCIALAEENDLSLTLAKARAMARSFQDYGFASYF